MSIKNCPPKHPLFSRTPTIVGILVVLFVTMIYLPALSLYPIGDDFEVMDAVSSFWENPAIIFHKLGLFFRPIYQLTNLVKYHLFQWYAPLFEVASITTHLLNVVLLYLLLLKLTHKVYLAATTASLFGTSPIHNEAVLWTGGQSDAVMQIFFLLTFIMLSKNEKHFGIKQHGLLMLCILGAAGAKGTWIVLPVLVVGFLWLVKQTPLKTAIIVGAPGFVMMIAYVIVFLVLPHFSRGQSPEQYLEGHVSSMLTKFIYLMWRYAGFGESFYGYAWQIVLTVIVLIGMLVMLTILNNRLALWGMAWMFLTMLPTLPVHHAPSRYDYLPLAGFWIMVIGLLDQFMRLAVRRFRIQRHLVISGIALAFACLIAYYSIYGAMAD